MFETKAELIADLVANTKRLNILNHNLYFRQMEKKHQKKIHMNLFI